jgi:hypothetical protein
MEDEMNKGHLRSPVWCTHAILMSGVPNRQKAAAVELLKDARGQKAKVFHVRCFAKGADIPGNLIRAQTDSRQSIL